MRRSHVLPVDSGGFSLVELSIVLVILAFFGGLFLSNQTRKVEARNRDALAAQFDVIDDALERFRALRGRYPCPAPLKEKEGAVGFGREDCSPATSPLGGTIPVRTLGLSDRYLYDPWNDRLAYRVLKPVTASGSFAAAIANTVFADNFEIRDRDSPVPINPTRSNAVVPWVLISYGADRAGAYDRMTGPSTVAPTVPCPATGPQRINCISVRQVRDMPFLTSQSGPASNYDDFVRWRAYPSPPEN